MGSKAREPFLVLLIEVLENGFRDRGRLLFSQETSSLRDSVAKRSEIRSSFEES